MPTKTLEQLNERVSMLQKKLVDTGEGADPLVVRRLKKSIRRAQRKSHTTAVALEKAVGKKEKEEAAKEA
jgi:hypothetical protein